MKRSSTVGIPSCRIPPPGLGISTRLTASGTYVPLNNCLRIFGHFLFRHSGNSCTVIPSIPGEPPFRFTLRRAVNRLSLSTTFSINCSSSTGLAVSAFDVNNPPLISKGNHNCFAGLLFNRLSVLQPYHLIPSQETVQAFGGGITLKSSSG